MVKKAFVEKKGSKYMLWVIRGVIKKKDEAKYSRYHGRKVTANQLAKDLATFHRENNSLPTKIVNTGTGYAVYIGKLYPTKKDAEAERKALYNHWRRGTPL